MHFIIILSLAHVPDFVGKAVSSCCAPEIDEIRNVIVIAVLRTIDSPIVPEDQRTEALSRMCRHLILMIILFFLTSVFQ
jgi:hypothetical protein